MKVGIFSTNVMLIQLVLHELLTNSLPAPVLPAAPQCVV
jgi:hypothetical protein